MASSATAGRAKSTSLPNWKCSLLLSERLRDRNEANPMTIEIANALSGYFETLYEMNRDLITLCGVNVIDNSGQYEKHIKDVIQAVPRLVPYDYAKKEKTYIINPRDGLLEFSDHLPFLLGDYEKILQCHNDFLSDVKIIRNKFEHKMHGARLVAGISGSSSVAFAFTYEVGDRKITLCASEIIRFVKDINCLFSKIQNQIISFAYENGKSDYPYYRRLIRYDFCDFNKIYESDVLGIVGKVLFPF